MPGATTFSGPLSAGAVEGALRGARERVLFTLPADAGWTLPLYELALLAAHELPARARADDRHARAAAAGPVRPDRLAMRSPVCWTARASASKATTVAEAVVGGALATRDGRLIAADAVIALARLQGPSIAGLPVDADGFIAVDGTAA